MKKITLLLMVLLLGVGGVSATELWTGSCTIGHWSGSTVTVEKESFSSAAAGNIVKVTFSAYAETESDNSTPVTYWQYSLGQKDNGWSGLTGFSGGDLTKGQKSASYTLTETNVTELQNYGLVVNGRYITITKVELLTISTTESIWTGSQPTGDWQNNVVLTYDDKGELANARINDYIKMTYTVTASGAQALIQNADWQDLVGKDDNSYDAEGTNTGKTLVYTIEDATTLENIQLNGILVKGKNITVTAVDLIEPDTRYDAVPLTIGTDGIATYGSSKNLDFSGINEVTPYYVSAVGSGIVTLTSVEKTRAWAGYIVKGTAGIYDIPVSGTEPDWIDAFHYLRYSGDYNGNWVYRSAYSDYSDGDDKNDTDTSTDEYKIKNNYRYIFAKKGSDDPGFYKLDENYSRMKDETPVYYHELAAHKAYLETPTDITPAGARVALVFSDEAETTGISASLGEKVEKASEHIYNLRGMRVTQPQKGLYIKNGKKMIIR